MRFITDINKTHTRLKTVAISGRFESKCPQVDSWMKRLNWLNDEASMESKLLRVLNKPYMNGIEMLSKTDEMCLTCW